MIRRATPADADALSVLARECFTQTFGHLYTPGDLTVFLDQAYSPAVLHSELQDPQRRDLAPLRGRSRWLTVTRRGLLHAQRSRFLHRPLRSYPRQTPQRPLFRGGSPGLVPRRTHRLCDRVPRAPAPPRRRARRRRGPAPLHSARTPGRRPRNPPALRTALGWLERDGPRTLWIGVWSENYGAQRFYARHGFEIVGRVLLHGRRPRRPRVHHPPPGERLTPTVLRLRGDNLQMLMPPGKTGGLAGRKEMR